MAKICPETGDKVLYLDCVDCDDKLICGQKGKNMEENNIKDVEITEELYSTPDKTYIYIYPSDNDTIDPEASGLLGYYIYDENGEEIDGGEVDMFDDDGKRETKEYIPEITEYGIEDLPRIKKIKIISIVNSEYLFDPENQFDRKNIKLFDKEDENEEDEY